MRISDWSSDVCSSDLDHRRGGLDHQFLLIVDRGDAQRIALPLPRPDDDERAVVDVVVLMALATEHGLKAEQRILLAAHRRQLAAADPVAAPRIGPLAQALAPQARQRGGSGKSVSD